MRRVSRILSSAHGTRKFLKRWINRASRVSGYLPVNLIGNKDQLKTFLTRAHPPSAACHLPRPPAVFIAEPGVQAPLQQHERRPGFDSKPLAFWFLRSKNLLLQRKFSRAIAANTTKRSTS